LNGFLFPILGAVALATGIVIQRTILKKRKIDMAKDIMVIFYENDAVRSSSLQKWLGQESKGVKEYPLLKKEN